MPDRPWYRSDPEALEETLARAADVQPYLVPLDDGHRVLLRGRFEIREAGGVLEAFAVDVQLADESPRHPPTVWETGGRIPRVRDRHHVNVEKDDSLCVLLPDAFWYYHPQGMSLAEFLDGPLRKHFAGQAIVLQGEDWPDGEWDHFTAGAIQFYREVLGVTDDETLFRLMVSVYSSRSKRRRMRCPCGSGKLRRQCHGPTLRALRGGENFVPVCKALAPPHEEAS